MSDKIDAVFNDWAKELQKPKKPSVVARVKKAIRDQVTPRPGVKKVGDTMFTTMEEKPTKRSK